MQPSVTGGATAPASTGPSGTTGATGASGATGTIGSTGPAGTAGPPPQALPTPSITAPLAPIVLPKGESPNYVYGGPVYVETATGAIVPYAPHTVFAAVAGDVPSAAGLPRLLVPGNTAEIINGLAAAPENAPPAVKQIIWNANRIIGRPYEYGGGHASFASYGYDCSGTVSFALHGGHLLSAPLDSSQFMGWGRTGQGRWMTILTNPAHAFLDIAGLRLDTSAADDPNNQQGPRWRPLRTSNPGYSIRHPANY